MTRLYALMYCFENAVRSLINERLSEHYGSSWWADKVPKKVKDVAESRQRDAQATSWLEGQKQDVLGFVDFGHLADLITNNWDDWDCPGRC